jgi:hypothetical protein
MPVFDRYGSPSAGQRAKTAGRLGRLESNASSAARSPPGFDGVGEGFHRDSARSALPGWQAGGPPHSIRERGGADAFVCQPVASVTERYP